MGICCCFWEKTPESVEHYLSNHAWPPYRDDLRLRYYDTGKTWTGLHYLFTQAQTRDSFPANFIMNGTLLPNYDIEEENMDDEYYVEITSPFLYSVEETKTISEFLDSLDKNKLRQGFNPKFLAAHAFPYQYYDDEEAQDDYFHWLYYAFEKLQRLFHKAASHNNCVIGRKS